MAKAVECLLRKCEALNSNPSYNQNKKSHQSISLSLSLSHLLTFANLILGGVYFLFEPFLSPLDVLGANWI
jgi:hypothetical protein